MTDVLDLAHPSPLTRLSEDEQLLRANVRAFAEAEIAPHVREMDEQAAIPQALIDQLFDLGVMGIEIPETFGGAGAHFFLSVIAVEELSRVDPSGTLMPMVERWDSSAYFLPAVISALEGMQPTLRQTPPQLSRSMHRVLTPSWPRRMAQT